MFHLVRAYLKINLSVKAIFTGVLLTMITSCVSESQFSSSLLFDQKIMLSEETNESPSNFLGDLAGNCKKRNKMGKELLDQIFRFHDHSGSVRVYTQSHQLSSEVGDVKIGSNYWMKKNLDVSTFRNGDIIPHARTKEEWELANENKQPAWCYYDHNPANNLKYGKLYNGFAVEDPRGLAPAGYHIPTHSEWKSLLEYHSYDMEKLRNESGWNDYTYEAYCDNCINWHSSYRSQVPCHVCKNNRTVRASRSGNGSNLAGFSALPGGYCYSSGRFDDLGYTGYWWCSDTQNERRISIRINRSPDKIFQGSYEQMDYGLSVRCVKDFEKVYKNEVKASSNKGIGSAIVTSWVMADRSFVKNPSLEETQIPSEGTVTVSLDIDANGNVISVVSNPSQSNTTDSALLDLAVNLAKRAKFNSSGKQRQRGSISFNFKLN